MASPALPWLALVLNLASNSLSAYSWYTSVYKNKTSLGWRKYLSKLSLMQLSLCGAQGVQLVNLIGIVWFSDAVSMYYNPICSIIVNYLVWVVLCGLFMFTIERYIRFQLILPTTRQYRVLRICFKYYEIILPLFILVYYAATTSVNLSQGYPKTPVLVILNAMDNLIELISALFGLLLHYVLTIKSMIETISTQGPLPATPSRTLSNETPLSNSPILPQHFLFYRRFLRMNRLKTRILVYFSCLCISDIGLLVFQILAVTKFVETEYFTEMKTIYISWLPYHAVFLLGLWSLFKNGMERIDAPTTFIPIDAYHPTETHLQSFSVLSHSEQKTRSTILESHVQE